MLGLAVLKAWGAGSGQRPDTERVGERAGNQREDSQGEGRTT